MTRAIRRRIADLPYSAQFPIPSRPLSYCLLPNAFCPMPEAQSPPPLFPTA